jgi:hypothetical protein
MEASDQLHGPAATRREGTPSGHWIGGLVGSVASLDAMEDRTYFVPDGNRIPAVLARHYTDAECYIHFLLFHKKY